MLGTLSRGNVSHTLPRPRNGNQIVSPFRFPIPRDQANRKAHSLALVYPVMRLAGLVSGPKCTRRTFAIQYSIPLCHVGGKVVFPYLVLPPRPQKKVTSPIPSRPIAGPGVKGKKTKATFGFGNHRRAAGGRPDRVVTVVAFWEGSNRATSLARRRLRHLFHGLGRMRW